jgi:hypothetical protein
MEPQEFQCSRCKTGAHSDSEFGLNHGCYLKVGRMRIAANVSELTLTNEHLSAGLTLATSLASERLDADDLEAEDDVVDEQEAQHAGVSSIRT